MNERRRLVAAVFLFVAANAVALQARGALLASFGTTFGVTESRLGLVAPAGTAGFLVAILAVGFAAGRLDLRLVLSAAAAATVGCLLLLGAAPAYSLFLAVLLAQGAAVGTFRGADRPVLSHLYPAERGRVFNLYALSWAAGAVVGPLLVTAVLAVTHWRATYLVLALLVVPVVALLRGVDTPASAAEERTLSPAALAGLVRRPAIAGTAVAMTLVGGIEGTVFTWLPYYAGELVSRGLANAALSAFLLAYVVGRATYSRVADRLPYLDVVLSAGLAAAPVLYVAFGGLGTPSPPALFGAVFVAGALVSGLFPTLLAFGVDAAPEYSGPINALGTGATSVGIAVVPAVVGVLAESAGVGPAMRLTAGIAVALAAVVAATRAVT